MNDRERLIANVIAIGNQCDKALADVQRALEAIAAFACEDVPTTTRLDCISAQAMLTRQHIVNAREQLALDCQIARRRA